MNLYTLIPCYWNLATKNSMSVLEECIRCKYADQAEHHRRICGVYQYAINLMGSGNTTPKYGIWHIEYQKTAEAGRSH